MELIAGIFLSLIIVVEAVYVIPKFFKGTNTDRDLEILLGGGFIVGLVWFVYSLQ